MRTFPQFGIGAPAQFPFDRSVSYRTVVNHPGPSTQILYADPDYEERRWRLPLQSLSDLEWQRVEDLFAEVSGRLESFLFLEPGSNCLLWSENLTDPAWTKTAIAVTSGQTDPLGGTNASLLSASGPGVLRQTIAAPSDFAYAASCTIRTEEAGVTLRLTDGAGPEAVSTVSADGVWRRHEVSFRGTPGEESVDFEIHIPSGASAEIFGPQLEGQTSASSYKKTTERAGLFPLTRFDHDHLPDRLSGPGNHSGEVRLIWTPSLT